MRQDGEATAPDVIGPRALREWLTGTRQAYPRVFLVDDGGTAEGVEAVAEREDVVLLPADSAPFAGHARVVHYRGALSDIGDELFIGERGVELQEYVAAAFVQIVGPTAVCILDASGWSAFLDDAELARRTGVFPSALIDPRVVLTDRGALTRPGELARPSALRVSAEGRVSVGVQGEVLGGVDELPALLALPLPRAVAWGDRAPREMLTDDRRNRERIERYLNATDLMKMLRVANGAAKISGFGWSVLDDGLADAEPLTADPFLLETPEGLVLADTGTLRRRLLSPATATVVAAIQTSSGLDLAVERVAEQLRVRTAVAEVLCLEAVSALDTHFGRRVDAS